MFCEQGVEGALSCRVYQAKSITFHRHPSTVKNQWFLNTLVIYRGLACGYRLTPAQVKAMLAVFFAG